MKQLLLIFSMLLVSTSSALADDPAPAAKPPAGSAPASGGAAPAADAQAKPKASRTLVRVVTNMGNFTIELNAERAPLTVQHFLAYVDEGFYTNTVFHRVIPDFVIQGGGLTSDYALKPASVKVVNESGNGLTNARGTVGAARGNDPHSSDAQFYINLSDNPALDPNPNRWGYAVFGKVVQGIEVVDKIANVPTGPHGVIKSDVPNKPVIIEKIERIATP